MSNRIDITLYSGRAERFEQIRDELEKQLGYEPSRPETVGHMMMAFDLDQVEEPDHPLIVD